jgi:MFS family permease
VTLRRGTLAVFAGLALFAAGMWLPSLPVFVVSGVITGAGGSLVVRGSLAAAAATAPPPSRAEVIAGYFLGAYAGLSIPVIGLGIADQYAPATSCSCSWRSPPWPSPPPAGPSYGTTTTTRARAPEADLLHSRLLGASQARDASW